MPSFIPAQMKSPSKIASKITSLPVLSFLSPRVDRMPSEETLEGFLRSQRLAQRAAKEIAGLMTEGWTEIQAAEMLTTYLRDSGVRSFFHHGFAWFGERAGFHGMRRPMDFMPSSRILRPGEAFILDVAPIYKGYISDIGYTSSLGENKELAKAKKFLTILRKEIPKYFEEKSSGSDIWFQIEKKILSAGYENAYVKYPFSVVGHRVHKGTEALSFAKVLNFGWQSYWSLLSRGLFGQLLNQNFEGNLLGLWAIEPHLSGPGFGAKFEEILVVGKDSAYWLDRSPEEK